MTPSHLHPHKKSCETLCLALDSMGGGGWWAGTKGFNFCFFFLPLWVLVWVLEVSPSPSLIFF